jgi:hypothetical protein
MVLVPIRSAAKVSVVAIILAAVPCTASSGDAALEAWWLGASFTADSTVYRGMPVSVIDPNWQKIGLITYNKLPREAKDDVSWMHKEGFVFEIEGNLSGKGFNDVAVTGVYEAQGGTSGRFLLVLRMEKDRSWHRFFLHEEPGERGFSVLVRKAGRIYWGMCMQCEEFRRLTIGSLKASLGE